MQHHEPPIHILLVDDRAENLAALEAILAAPNLLLVQAQSGSEALRHLLRQDFAVILLDVQMPDMDGFETARYIRSRPRSQHTPIIFLTALDSRDTNVFQGYSAGAVDFMFKPFMPDVLRYKVSVFVQLYKNNLELQRHAHELEERVAARTEDLMHANQALKLEIGERERIELALRFLTDAADQLARSLDYEHTLNTVVRLAVPFLADTCLAAIPSAEGLEQYLRLAHINPAHEAEYLELIERVEFSWELDQPAVQTVRAGKVHFAPQATFQLLDQLEKNPIQAAWVAALRSAIMLPIQFRDHVAGMLVLMYGESGRTYSESDLPLAQDLARRASLALEHAALYRDLQNALQARDQFLSIASHELKTPITAVLGYAQLLSRRLSRNAEEDPRNLQALQTLVEQCQRLDRLIRSLLDLSRLQTGQFVLERHPTALLPLLQRVIDETLPTLRNHILKYDPPAEPLTIIADELRLSQVIHNLVQNAIKYSPDGGTITVDVQHNEHTVNISIHDEGLGIPSHAIPLLFERFYRANNVDGNIGGMGLGLYVVREIVSLHGGHVDVTSTEHEGSTFTITLPLT